MLLYGAGPHAEVIYELLQACNLPFTGVFDEHLRVFPSDTTAQVREYDPKYFSNTPLVIAIGDNATRRKLSKKITHPLATLVHPDSFISPSAQLGKGTVVLPGALVHTKAHIGNHVILNSRSIIEHHCVMEDFVHIAPGVILCGNCSVGESSMIGAGSILLPGISVGKNCVVGAGSVVSQEVPDHSRAVGSPARILPTKEV